MSTRYNKENIKEALHAVGLREGDTVFSHSNIGFFGVPEGDRSIENAYTNILDAILETIGKNGTFIVPTFSYSFCQGKIFSVQKTPSDCGIFSEMIRLDPRSFRSLDPNISVCAIGSKAELITKDTSKNSYGDNSFFARFMNEGGKVCNMNFDAGSTFIHYVERLLDVPYRFDKSFPGTIAQDNGKHTEDEYSIFVRDDSTDDTIASFEKFDQIAKNRNKYVVHPVGRGMVGCITADDTYNLIKEELIKTPNLLIQGSLHE